MADINFVPEWYPVARRRRMLLRSQAWASAAAVLGMLIYGVACYREAQRAESRLETTRDLLAQKRKEVKQLDEMLALEAELRQKQRLVAELGLPVEVSRLLAEVTHCAPGSLSLASFAAKTAEHAVEAPRGSRGSERPLRRLEVELRGNSPSQTDISLFLSAIAERQFLQDVRLMNSEEKAIEKRTVREFTVDFSISLEMLESPAPQTRLASGD